MFLNKSGFIGFSNIFSFFIFTSQEMLIISYYSKNKTKKQINIRHSPFDRHIIITELKLYRHCNKMNFRCSVTGMGEKIEGLK